LSVLAVLLPKWKHIQQINIRWTHIEADILLHLISTVHVVDIANVLILKQRCKLRLRKEQRNFYVVTLPHLVFLSKISEVNEKTEEKLLKSEKNLGN
jgi:hypothetical protein